MITGRFERVSQFHIYQISKFAFPGLTGFDSKVLCTYKHAVRWIISTLI